MSEETLLLDQENELYGYGIYNTETNALLDLSTEAENNTWFDNDQLVTDKEKIEEAMKRIASEEFEDSRDASDLSHLRIVRVNLANELDLETANELDEHLSNLDQ